MIKLMFLDLTTNKNFTKDYDNVYLAKKMINKVNHSQKLLLMGYQADNSEESEELANCMY